jgi:hypothetical protein
MFAVAGGMQKMSQDPGLDGRNIFRKLCVSVGSYTPCQRIWCGACYTFNPKLKFHIHKVETKTGLMPGMRRTRNLTQYVQPAEMGIISWHQLKMTCVFQKLPGQHSSRLAMYVVLLWSRYERSAAGHHQAVGVGKGGVEP